MAACQQKILVFCISLFILVVGNSNRVEVCYGYKEEGLNKEKGSTEEEGRNKEEGSNKEEGRYKEKGSTEKEGRSKEKGRTEKEGRSKEKGRTEKEGRSKEEDYRQAAIVTGLSGTA
jgi:hypothetical protein